MTLRDDLIRILSDPHVKGAEETADEILALKGFYTEYGFCNDWDPVTPFGQTHPDKFTLEHAAKTGYHLVARQRFEGEWVEVTE